MVARGAATAMLVMFTAATLLAECIGLSDGVARGARAADFVFDGTVMKLEHVTPDGTRTRIDVPPGGYGYGMPRGYLGALAQPEDNYLREYAATLTVHRVWKGTVSRTTTVYFTPNVDGPFFETDHRYVVYADRQGNTSRDRSGIDPATPYRDMWVSTCSGSPSWDNKEALKVLERVLGRSRKPS